MEFRLLGEVEARIDGRFVDLGHSRQRCVLAVLLLEANRVVPTERLIERVWADRPPQRARVAVSGYVSRLRRILARSADAVRITRRSGGYLLAVDSMAVDVHRFAELVSRARQARDSGRQDQAVELFAQALRLWSSEAFEGMDTPWLNDTREVLDTDRSAAVLDSNELVMAAGGHSGLLAQLSTYTAGHPLDERAAGQLVLALYRCGRQADALQHYERVRRRLAAELGADPGQALQRLHRQILTADPALSLQIPDRSGVPTATPPPMEEVNGHRGAPPPHAIPAPRQQHRAAGFVGRGFELGQLAAALDLACAGRGQVVTVCGPAGIGKTRLCQEGAALASAAGFTVVWGRCWSGGGAPALWPWKPILGELCGPAAAGLLGQDADGLFGHDRPEREPQNVDPERFSRFTAVVERLAALSAPVFLVIDDLHAAEPGAVLLTEFVARMRHQLRLVMVVTAREDDRSGPGAGVSGTRLEGLEPEATRVELGRLTVADTAAFLAAHDVADPDPDLLAAVHQVTAGNPLHLHRLLALGAPGGPGRPRRSCVLPTGMRNVIERSVRQVGNSARRVLARSTILGPTPSVAGTSVVAGVGSAEVLDAVGEAAGFGLVCMIRSDSFEFSHDLVRESLAATLSARERVDTHARALAALGDGGAGESHELTARRAHHAVHAAGRSRADAAAAVAACRAAAASMIQRYDYEQAAQLLSTAVELHERASLGAPAADLLLEWARAVQSTGRLTEARTVYGRAVEAARAAGDPAAYARAALGLGGVWVNEHRDHASRERVLALQRDAMDGLGPDHAALRCHLQIRLSADMVYVAGHPVADVLAGLEQARRLGDRQLLAEALSLTHHALLRPDHTTDRLPLAEELIAVASAAGDGVLALMGLCWRTVDLFHLGDPGAERALADLRVRAEALHCRSIRYVAAVLDVMLTIRAGRLSQAEEAAATAFGLGQEVGDADAFGYHAAHLLAIRWMQGRGAELVDLAAEAAMSPTLVLAEFTFQATLARLAAEAGQLQRARHALDRLTQAGLAALPQSSTWLAGMLGIVETAAALGDAGIAGQAYHLLRPYADLPIMPSLAVVCFGSVHRPLGLAALTVGDIEASIHHLRDAVHANTRLGNHPMTTCAQAELAQVLRRRGRPGDHRQARHLLLEASGNGAAMGMNVRAERWRAEALEGHRVPARETPLPRAGALSGVSRRATR